MAGRYRSLRIRATSGSNPPFGQVLRLTGRERPSTGAVHPPSRPEHETHPGRHENERQHRQRAVGKRRRPQSPIVIRNSPIPIAIRASPVRRAKREGWPAPDPGRDAGQHVAWIRAAALDTPLSVHRAPRSGGGQQQTASEWVAVPGLTPALPTSQNQSSIVPDRPLVRRGSQQPAVAIGANDSQPGRNREYRLGVAQVPMVPICRLRPSLGTTSTREIAPQLGVFACAWQERFWTPIVERSAWHRQPGKD